MVIECISLRDQFAMAALVARSAFVIDTEEGVARFCYRVADAMLKERKPHANPK